MLPRIREMGKMECNGVLFLVFDAKGSYLKRSE